MAQILQRANASRVRRSKLTRLWRSFNQVARRYPSTDHSRSVTPAAIVGGVTRPAHKRPMLRSGADPDLATCQVRVVGHTAPWTRQTRRGANPGGSGPLPAAAVLIKF